MSSGKREKKEERGELRDEGIEVSSVYGDSRSCIARAGIAAVNDMRGQDSKKDEAFFFLLCVFVCVENTKDETWALAAA
jgi:hypothetical protein